MERERGFDDKEFWESKWVRSRGADVSTYESLKQRKREKERQKHKDRNRAMKLSIALWLTAQSMRPGHASRLVLMFYSSANGEILFWSHCRTANPAPLEQRGIKLKPSRYAMTSQNHDQALLIKKQIICQVVPVQWQPQTHDIIVGWTEGLVYE